MDDTAKNLPESKETLIAQQKQLLEGRRLAQMFPVGTKELPLPTGFSRVTTPRGTFHYDPNKITKERIIKASSELCENEILGLGPYSKKVILKLHEAGEEIIGVTERTPTGIEVKAAIGAKSTIPHQLTWLDSLKTPGNKVCVETIKQILAYREANHGR